VALGPLGIARFSRKLTGRFCFKTFYSARQPLLTKILLPRDGRMASRGFPSYSKTNSGTPQATTRFFRLKPPIFVAILFYSPATRRSEAEHPGAVMRLQQPNTREPFAGRPGGGYSTSGRTIAAKGAANAASAKSAVLSPVGSGQCAERLAHRRGLGLADAAAQGARLDVAPRDLAAVGGRGCSAPPSTAATAGDGPGPRSEVNLPLHRISGLSAMT